MDSSWKDNTDNKNSLKLFVHEQTLVTYAVGSTKLVLLSMNRMTGQYIQMVSWC